MFGISGEHLLVLLVILLIFGPRRLPDLGHSLGRTFRNFKDGLDRAGQPEAPRRDVPATGAERKVAAGETAARATTPAAETAAAPQPEAASTPRES
jgi:sec-independent protein translocase protein TatA